VNHCRETCLVAAIATDLTSWSRHQVPVMANSMVDSLHAVCDAAVRALSASGSGMSVMTESGIRGVMVASDPVSERIEDLQFVLGEGPCLDALATRRPVLVEDLGNGTTGRWPAYACAAHGDGIRAVFAFPLQVGAAQLGVLDIFRTTKRSLSADELGQALAIAETAVTTLLDGQGNAQIGEAFADLDEAVEGHAELFQAQGMVMVQLGGTLAEAMTRIRAYTFAEDRRLIDVARDIVARQMRFDRDH
jgi:hypothetical protein